MDHLVMIVGGYYPNPSATGRVADQLISLVSAEYRTSVVCLSRGKEVVFERENKNVVSAGTGYSHIQYRLRKKKLIYYLAKSPVYIMDLFRHPNNLHWYANAAYKRLEDINRTEPIDIVFSVGAPISSHCAASKFKKNHPTVRWVTYSVDSYAAQNGNKRRFCKFEKNLLGQADYNFLSEEIYANSSFLYDGVEEKFEPLPYLMPSFTHTLNRSTKEFFDGNSINVVYAGSFYREIRNPEFLLRLFKRVSSGIILHLYCTSDCDATINSMVAASGGKIVRHNTVSPEEIMEIYSAADILVSVGNSLSEFKPSKTFEYISTGKPILNIYYPRHCDEVLDKYPAVLQICNDEDINTACQRLEEFFRLYAGKIVSRDMINGLYSKHSSEKIRERLLRGFREQGEM